MNAENEQALIDYWKHLFQLHGYPHRKHLNPSDIIKLLPNIVIMEHEIINENSEYIVRLAGTKIDEMAGINLKGCKISDLHDQKTDAIFRENFIKLVEGPYGAKFYRKNISPEGREMGVTMTVLPFRGKKEGSPQILFYHSFEEESGYGEEKGTFIANPIEYWEFIDIGFGLPAG